MKGFIVDSSHIVIGEKTYIQLFGRLENGKSFFSLHDFEPYCFIQEKDLKKAKHLLSKYKVEKTKLTNFKEKKVIKITANIPAEITKLISAFEKKGIESYEADLKPTTRFIIDNDLLGSLEFLDKGEIGERTDLLFQNPKIKPTNSKPNLKVISLDIESDKKMNDLFCIGLYGENYKKNFIISNKKIPNAVSCKNEPDLLSKFKEELIKIDPDIITGWHVIDFDLMFLKKKFEEHKIPFDIGRTNQNASIRISQGFFRASSAKIPGRQVLDALNLIKDPFIKEAPSIKQAKFDSYTLEDVSQEILGEGKLLKGKARHEKIEELYKKDQKKLVEYNLQDCKLVFDILKKTKIIELAIERSTLTGLPLDRITASIAAFDSLYIREARKKGLVSKTNIYGFKEERIKGGYVMDSKPGIYHNVLVLDFKSLYPSIIKTFNIDPSSYLEKKEPGSIESPNKAYFKNSSGILPGIIENLHQAREKAKKEKRELSSYAIKIIQNSFFGVLASPNCRYFSLKMANAITHFGQYLIKLTAKKIEERGYKVIYSDTDSVFVETDLGKEKANLLGKKIEEYINKFYNDFVKKNYNRKSYLELEFEKQYLSFLLPPVRHSERGSKKRYAGLIEKHGKEEIQIIGLEAIRGDWTEAAQEFQKELLNRIFHRKEFLAFIKSYVKKIESGKLDEKLLYKKSIRKSLKDYTKITPPHVKAARKLDKLDSNIIRYYITTDGPEPIQKLKHKIDYKHYIEKQIKPIASTILFFFDRDFDEIIATSKQTKLF
ncbi:MAG: DNA polymerase II [Nanoarchaeota archaeon]|nr:DNA polymerase II [Nanoarchaeota archaeon]